MENYTLTTARAARLLGLALIIWSLCELIARQAYLHIEQAHVVTLLGKDHPLAQADSLFVVSPSLVAPSSIFITGLLLIIFCRGIQWLLR